MSLKCPVIQPPPYQKFLQDYLKTNKPVLIGPAIVESWPAIQLWIKHSLGHSEIDLDYLSDHYGDLEVAVADCSSRDDLGNQDRTCDLLRNVISKWRTEDGASLYVKDWHLSRNLDKSDSYYSTPNIFCDDWMNAYYAAYTNDDFRFVYLGAKGTFTPLHRDVYTSYSWSSNVCGRKRWWLYPPDQTKYLFMKQRSVTPYDVRTADPEKFQELHRTSPIVLEQNEGETIFVPSGWYHQVENLTDCISINHNWCNSNNISSMYTSMCEKVEEVEQALEDVKELLSSGNPNSDDWRDEWVTIVQDVVKQDAGWNWLTFWRMVLYALESAFGTNTEVLGPPASDLSFVHASEEYRPPKSFIVGEVKKCYDDFVTRDHRERSGEWYTL
ncbi:tRNA wybutosine-synthesizing protein 4 [Abortiporus biennis]